METRTFSKFERARIRRTAQNVYQFITQRERLMKRYEEMGKEIESLNKTIEAMDAPNVSLTGYPSSHIIKRVKIGNVYKYEFIYPNVIPDTPIIEESEELEENLEPEVMQQEINFN